MIEKLTKDQQEELADLCERINYIFTEEDNDFTEESLDEYFESSFYKGVWNVMYELGRWC